VYIGLGLGLHPNDGDLFNPSTVFTGATGGWYDPSDLTTLFQDTAGTTPVTTDGQSVARINDKSGNGLHLTQATAGSRPLYKTANGLSWLLHDGVDDCLFKTTPITGVNQSIAASVSDVIGSANRAIWADIVSASDRIILSDSGSSIIAGYYNGTVYTSKSGAANASPHVDLAEIIKGTSTNLRVNTAAQVGTTNPASIATVGVCLGGTAPSGGIMFSGRCYGLLQIARALTADERAGLETYMGAKAGIGI
jgi:hypothetical protein